MGWEWEWEWEWGQGWNDYRDLFGWGGGLLWVRDKQLWWALNGYNGLPASSSCLLSEQDNGLLTFVPYSLSKDIGRGDKKRPNDFDHVCAITWFVPPREPCVLADMGYI